MLLANARDCSHLSGALATGGYQKTCCMCNRSIVRRAVESRLDTDLCRLMVACAEATVVNHAGGDTLEAAIGRKNQLKLASARCSGGSAMEKLSARAHDLMEVEEKPDDG